MQDFFSGRALSVLAPVSAGTLLLATLWFHLRPSPTLTVVESLPPAAAAPANPNTDFALQEIPSWQLFGALADPNATEVTVQAPAPGDALAELPPTSIDLKVSGIAYSPDSHRAYAIVGAVNAPQRQYRAGDVLSEGVTVHSIRPLEVVISNQGKLESLALPLESMPGGASAPDLYARPNLPQFPGIPPGMPEIPVQEPGPLPTTPNQ